MSDMNQQGNSSFEIFFSLWEAIEQRERDAKIAVDVMSYAIDVGLPDCSAFLCSPEIFKDAKNKAIEAGFTQENHHMWWPSNQGYQIYEDFRDSPYKYVPCFTADLNAASMAQATAIEIAGFPAWFHNLLLITKCYPYANDCHEVVVNATAEQRACAAWITIKMINAT